MCQVLMKYIEPDGKDNDLKIASSFSKYRFLKFKVHFLQGIMGNIQILLLMIMFVLQASNEPMMIVIHLFSHVL